MVYICSKKCKMFLTLVAESVLTFDILVRERCPTYLVMRVDTRKVPELDFVLLWWLVMLAQWK